MGTDVRFYIERKNKQGNWELVKSLDIDRNYTLFGLLANIRVNNNGNGIKHGSFPPKEELSPDLYWMLDDKQGHDRTCITLKEFLDFDWLKPWDDFLGKEYVKKMFSLKKGLNDMNEEYWERFVTYIERFRDIPIIIGEMWSVSLEPTKVRAIMIFDS